MHITCKTPFSSVHASMTASAAASASGSLILYCYCHCIQACHCDFCHTRRNAGPVQVAELGSENEQLRWELKSAQQKQQQAEQRLQQQQDQSDKLAAPTQSSQADTSRLRGDLDALRRQNSELSSELAAACQSLKAEQALVLQKQREHQQHRDSAERASWALQHQVDNLTQENQSLIAHHEQLETKFKSLTKQLAKAQHDQHAGAQSKSDQAETLARACSLQEQVNSLLESSAVQVEQRHRLENEVATLQRRLAGAESALSQHQHKVRGHHAAESASNGKVAMLQHQAESVVEENLALQAQCRQSAADMKQLQNDVQVSKDACLNLTASWLKYAGSIQQVVSGVCIQCAQ